MLFFKNIHAQEIPLMENVNITNSRSFQKNSTTGKNIAIIDGKWFNMLPVLSIDDLLKYTSGIEIQQRGPAGSQADIVIRGGTFQQVLVLIDGMKWNDAITGHFSGYLPITPSEIERIEIIKGPASAMYGSEAVGGVINIISKTFFNNKRENKDAANASVVIGEYGLTNFQLGVNENKNKLKYAIGANSNNADGQLLRSNNRGYFNNNTFSGSLAFSPVSGWKLSIHSSFDGRDFAAQNFYTTFTSDTATEKVNTWWNHLQVNHTSGKSSDQINAIYKKTFDQYRYNSSSIANENRSSNIQLQYIHTQKKSEQFNYLFGILTEQKQIKSNDRGNHTNNHLALFASSCIDFKKININPGFRFVMDENYGTQWLPQINLSYPVKHFNFRGGIGKAIRAADFTERFNNFNKAFVKGGSIGNPNLTAEQSWSYELGTDVNYKELNISTSAFLRDQNDLIDFVNSKFGDIPRNQNLDSNGKYAYAKNIKKITTKGLEFDIKFSHTLCKDLSFNTKSSFLFLDSKSSDAVPSYYILSHAKLLIQQIFDIKYKRLTISITGVYKERKAQNTAAINANISKSYFLWNSRIQYSCNNFSTFVNLNNIGDINYSDLLGSRMPGRWLSAGFSINL